MRPQILAERYLGTTFQQARRFAVETHDVAQHAVKRRPQQIAPLREQGVERGAVVLEPARLVAHAEAHRACLRLDPQFVEQRNEVRISPVVEHDETGVDGVTFAIQFDRVRVRVAADMAARLEHRNVVVTVQTVRNHVAGDAAADDGDFHAGAPL